MSDHSDPETPRAPTPARAPARIAWGLFRRPSPAGDVIFASAFFALTLLLLCLLPWQTQWAARSKLYLQPSFWSALSLITMALFSAGYLVCALVSSRGKTDGKADAGGAKAEVLSWLRSVEFVLWFLAYVLLVPQLGYLISTIAFACALSWRMGYRTARWMGFAALFGVLVVVVFKSLLGVNIPAGAVYDLLPSGPARLFIMTHF